MFVIMMIHVQNNTLACRVQIPTNPDEDAVRIFIEFERQESAIKGDYADVTQ